MPTGDRAKEAFYVGPPTKDKLPKVYITKSSDYTVDCRLIYFPLKQSG